jgi:VanZ family protein
LHFGDYGSIFSAGDFKADSASNTGCALEVWLEPAVTEDFTTTLAFSTESNPLQFRLRQLEDSLSVSRNTLNEKHAIHNDRIWVQHVFREHQPLLITLSSGPNGTAVYLNGKLRQNYPGFKLSDRDFTGRLVFGDSPLGHETWGGDLRGLAIYPHEISADRVKNDDDVWSSGAEFPADAAASATALYLFREGSGRVTRSSVASAPDLVIPAKFESMRPVLLKPFWEEYNGNWEYWADLLVNILAFVPFGFLFCGYLTVGRSVKRPLWLALAAGFLVSLTIELGQYYLPMRNSGTTDLITNTTGAVLGAWLFGMERVRRVVDSLAGKRPFAGRPVDG